MHGRDILKNIEQLLNAIWFWIFVIREQELRNWENQVLVQFRLYNDPNWNLIHFVSLPQSLKRISLLAFKKAVRALGKILLPYNACFNSMCTSSFFFRAKFNYLLKCNVIVKFQCCIALTYKQAFCYGDFVNSHAQAALPGYFSITH